MGFAFEALRTGADSWWMVPIRIRGLAEAAADSRARAANFMVAVAERQRSRTKETRKRRKQAETRRKDAEGGGDKAQKYEGWTAIKRSWRAGEDEVSDEQRSKAISGGSVAG